jgi:tRNA pseudouridine55 synthase
MNGLLVIDKPGGMTSRDVVNRVQRWFPRRTKIGHTGTLDPLATGVLVLCVGAATKLASYVQDKKKTYQSRFRLGATSTTDDADGVVTASPAVVPATRGQVDSILSSFIGEIEQVPPAFSALMLEGRRAHELARRGDEVNLAARTVCIDAIRVLGYKWPFLDVEIDCGKGTYVRSIARDLGAKLGRGGMVETLRRTRVGGLRPENGVGLDATPDEARAKLLPMVEAVAQLRLLRLEPEMVRQFRKGQVIRCPEGSGLFEPPPGQVIGLLDPTNGELAGLGRWERGRWIHPVLVMPG